MASCHKLSSLAVVTASLASMVATEACGSLDSRQGDVSRSLSLSPNLLAPKGLLDRVQRLFIDVRDATDITCDESTGLLSGAGASSRPSASVQLGTAGCKEGVRFCGTLALSRSSTKRFVSVRGLVANDELVAVGCAPLVADQENQELLVRIVRVVKPDVCGDGIVGSTEQCDPPGVDGDDVCDPSCHSREVFLSKGSGVSGGTLTGKRGDKVKPSFVWPVASRRAGKFIAFFGDRSPPGQTEVTVRTRSDVFGRYTEQGPGVENDSFYMPNDPGGAFPPVASPFNQFAPVAAISGSRTFVVFQDDSGGSVDVRFRTFSDTFVAGQGPGGALAVNGTTDAGEPGIQDSPSVAASPSGTLFVAWRDVAGGGRIVGRTIDAATLALGTAFELSSGANNVHPSVAATSVGFVCTWDTGAEIRMRSMGLDGAPTAPSTVVNDTSRAGMRSEPVVAALEGGEIAVAWTESNDASGKDVYLQRFSESGGRTPNDQNSPLHEDRSGDQSSPALTGFEGSAAGFAVAWSDASTGHVRALLIRRDAGTHFNSVDGQAASFVASRADGRSRANPTLVVGGSVPSLVIGWEDTTGDNVAGIYARRFPIPTE